MQEKHGNGETEHHYFPIHILLRAFQDERFDYLHDGILNIAQTVENEFYCQIQVQFNDGYPAVINNVQLYDKIKGFADFEDMQMPSMISEDFFFYQRILPGVFFFLEVGNTSPLHADTFDFKESILLKDVDFFETLAEQYH